MTRWFEIHEQLGIVCDLLASLREPGNLANHFLNIASALESYHRRVNGEDKKSAGHKARLERIYGAVEEEDLEWLKATLAFSHQPSLLSRLQDILEATSAHFESKIGNSDRWAAWLKNGRNAIAHRGPKMVDIEKEWRAAYAMTRSAEWLLVVLLLQDLGLPQDHIKWVLGRQQSWGFMTNHLRHAVPSLFT